MDGDHDKFERNNWLGKNKNTETFGVQKNPHNISMLEKKQVWITDTGEKLVKSQRLLNLQSVNEKFCAVEMRTKNYCTN